MKEVMRRLHVLSLTALALLIAVSATAALGSDSTTYSNSALPVLSGSARVGQTLSVTTGSWSPAPPHYRYAWHRCKDGTCTLSPTTADQSTYVVQPADVGYGLTAQVAPDGDWSQSENSAVTSPVQASSTPAPAPAPATTTAASTPTTTATTTTTTTTSPHHKWTRSTTTATTPTTTETTTTGTTPQTTTTGTTAQTTTTTTAKTTTVATPSASGDVYFDGRATRMTKLFSTSDSNQGQSPSLWACLCFLNNDISLTGDSRFGTAYAATAGPGSQNPWWTPPYGTASAEVSVSRPIRLGQWDWYANSYKVLPGWTSTDWATVTQMNFDRMGVGIERSVGYVSSVGGDPQIHDVQRFFPVSTVVGKWVDFVVGVKWATDTTGSIRVYTRCRECGDKDWVLRYSKDNVITMQWGAGVMDKNGNSPSTGKPISSLDKEGLYYGYWSTPSSMPTDHVLEMGLVRAGSSATAMDAVP
jgi:hypothetical protein